RSRPPSPVQRCPSVLVPRELTFSCFSCSWPSASVSPPLSTRGGRRRAALNRVPLPRGSNLLQPGITEELPERTVVGGDGGGVGVLVRAVQPVAADAEDDGVRAPLVVETPVRGAVLAQEIGAVTLVARGLLEAADLRAVPVGVVRRVSVVDDRGDARLAEGRQVGGDLCGGLAVQVGVFGR